jgi:hypothetical protein
VGVAYSQEQSKDRETRIDDCNHCYCYNNTWICSLVPCHPTPPSRRVKRGVPVAADLKNTPCAPNDYFKLDCNTCYCNIDKTGYLCTENLCPISEPTTESQSNDTVASNNTASVNETVPQTATASLNETVLLAPHSNETGLNSETNLTITNPERFSNIEHNLTNPESFSNVEPNLTNSESESFSSLEPLPITNLNLTLSSNSSNHSDAGGGTSKNSNVTDL